LPHGSNSSGNKCSTGDGLSLALAADCGDDADDASAASNGTRVGGGDLSLMARL